MIVSRNYIFFHLSQIYYSNFCWLQLSYFGWIPFKSIIRSSIKSIVSVQIYAVIDYTWKQIQIYLLQVLKSWRRIYREKLISIFYINSPLLIKIFIQFIVVQPSGQHPKLLASLSGYCYPKISFSIPTYQLARFGLIAMDSV